MISDPIYSSKTIRRVVISSRPSHTSCKMSVVHVFYPRCRGFMNISWIGIIDVIHGQLNKDFLMGVKNEWFKLNGLTLIFSPGRMIIELMSAFLQGKTLKKIVHNNICDVIMTRELIRHILYLLIFRLRLLKRLSTSSSSFSYCFQKSYGSFRVQRLEVSVARCIANFPRGRKLVIKTMFTF